MIIFFHSLYFIYKFLCKYYHRQTVLQDFLLNLKQCQELSKNEAAAINNESNLESLAVLKFDPPVYLQRYCDVQELLLDVRWGSEMAKIVEFGCAELKLFTYLKRLLYVKEILHVDIDEELLKDSLFRIEPLTVDHLQQRSYPLVVQVLAGSVSDPDYRLRGADAVIAIELIEHLYPDTLEALPYNIFSYIRPKIVILTTPNADFNVLFPDFSGMRHYDHKFEWTRAQFQDWCEHIVKRFPQYSVTFQGCGIGPAGSEHLGCCSQIAIFTKNYDCMDGEVPVEYCNIIAHDQLAMKQQFRESDSSFGICTYYSYSKVLEELSASSLSVIGSLKNTNGGCTLPELSEVTTQNFYRLVHKIDYPFYPDLRSPEEVKLDEARYKIHQARIYKQRYYNEELNKLVIPVYDLIYNNLGQFSTVAEMSTLLSNAGFVLEQCVCDGSGQPTTCVIQHLDMDSSRTTSISELSDTPATDDDPTNHQLCTQIPTDTNQDEDCYWDNVDGAAVGKPWKDEQTALSSSLQLGAITATLINTTDTADTKPSPGHNSDQLIDSGYQKSITSTAEWSPQSPLQDGMFEEQFLSCNDGRSPPVDPMLVQQSTNTEEVLVDKSPAVQKKMFISCALSGAVSANIVVGKEAVGVACTTAPGTSITATNGKKMKKDVKDSTGTRKKSRSKIHDLVEEDVRDLTQCLILNSINTIQIEEHPVLQSPELSSIAAEEPQANFPLVQDKQQHKENIELLQKAEPEDELVHPLNGADAPLGLMNLLQHDLLGNAFEPLEVDVLVGQGVVENGDLANNNRDLEGNNYPDIDLVDVQENMRRDMHELEDNLNENIENNVDVAIALGFPVAQHRDNDQDEIELANQHEDIANRNNVQNMPDIQHEQHQPLQEPLHPILIDLNEIREELQLHAIGLPAAAPPPSMNAIEEPSHSPTQIVQPDDSIEPPELSEVHRASREALFDSDSQIDLLDDLHLPGVAHVYEHVDEVDDHEQRPRNIVLVGINRYDEDMEEPFPLWLLQLLGDDGEQHDEPHFYCQGDGVGVHPSIVEVDIEDDDQSTSSSSADTSSAEENATATGIVTLNMDELMEQPISLPRSSHGMLNDVPQLLDGQVELEVIGFAVQRLRNTEDQSATPSQNYTATTTDSISPRTSLGNIVATTTTNLLDLNGSSNSTDRDSSDDMFFDTTDDLPLMKRISKLEVPLNEVQIEEQNEPAPEVVVCGSFRCFEGNSVSSSESETGLGYQLE